MSLTKKEIVGNIYRRLALISPRIEVMLRKLYWKHAGRLKAYRPQSVATLSSKGEVSQVSFDDIISFLKDNGVGEGSLLVVHSSYSELECTGLTSDQIVDRLLGLIRPTGTLAMPAIRRFKGTPKYTEILTAETDNLILTYNLRKTMVSSGLLPYAMLRRKDSEVSQMPFNPLVAIGPLAKPMMEHNLDGDAPSPHGPNSCWKFCYDHDAFVVGLGVDLNHYNTISHINEEAFGNWKWSDEEWYRKRKFVVIDEEGNSKDVVVRERKPEWGMLRFAELNANKDRNSNGLIHRTKINDELIVCIEKAREYVDHLQENNKKGKFFYI